MDDDLRHLQLLSIFHFVVGGLMALFACFPIIYLFIGIAMVTGSLNQGGGGQAPPPALGWIFIGGASVFILLGWSMAICIALGGYMLSQRRGYTFCLVAAGLACLFQPLGTILGVFTFIVLMRPSVKELFGQGGATQPQPEEQQA